MHGHYSKMLQSSKIFFPRLQVLKWWNFSINSPEGLVTVSIAFIAGYNQNVKSFTTHPSLIKKKRPSNITFFQYTSSCLLIGL